MIKDKLKPTNEQGVVALLIDFLDRHGFDLIGIQSAFPDARIRDRKSGLHYLVELEYYSSGFILHGHNPVECDAIICWEHDVPEKVIPLPISIMCSDTFSINSAYNDLEKEIWYLQLENERLQRALERASKESVKEYPTDWRNLRPNLSDEDLYNIAYLSPADVKVTANKFDVTERTVENWRSYAREELGV